MGISRRRRAAADWVADEILRRFDLKLMRYSRTYPARRNRILVSAGVEVVLDVGGNVGQYGRGLRGHGFAGRIVSFEPLSGPFGVLQRSAADLGLWDVERLAVGSDVGEIEINVSQDSVYSSALPLTSAALEANHRAAYVSVERVEVEPIDLIVSRLHLDPARVGLKIDVQGFEREVLVGSRGSLEGIPYLEIELTPHPVYVGQILMPEVLELTSAVGLHLVLVENVFPDGASGRSLQFDGIFARQTG